jgi:hypothetical protein
MNQIKRFIASACTISTLITLLVYLVTAIIRHSEGIGETGIPAVKFFLILLFSFLLAGANLLFGLKRLAFIWRLLLHYSVCLVAFLVIFIAFGNLNISGPASVFVAVIVLTVLYAAIAGAILGFLYAIRAEERKEKERRESSEYRSRYR